jgi:hypothetical protein
MTKDEALKQALETLEGLFGTPSHVHQGGAVAVWRLGGSDAPRRAITAIKEALAQPEQEPAKWEPSEEWLDRAVAAALAQQEKAELEQRNT